MDLEDRTLISKGSFRIEIATVHRLRKNKNDYDIFIDKGHDRVYVTGSYGKNFAKQLKKGDKLLIIEKHGRLLALYGPVKESSLYSVADAFKKQVETNKNH